MASVNKNARVPERIGPERCDCETAGSSPGLPAVDGGRWPLLIWTYLNPGSGEVMAGARNASSGLFEKDRSEEDGA